MTPHDLELKRYNHISMRLDQLEEQIRKLAEYDAYNSLSPSQQDAIVLAGVYCLDAKDSFRRYAERQDA